MNQFYLYILLIGFFLFSCKEPETPQPESYSGYIVVSCGQGPYYLSVDSLKANCGANEALPSPLVKSRLDSVQLRQLMLSNSCFYDENPSKLGIQGNHEVKLERSRVLNAIELTSSFSSTPISMTLDSTVLSVPSTDYPLMGAYEVDLNPGTFTIYMINIWVGGCLHDMIIWELVDG